MGWEIELRQGNKRTLQMKDCEPEEITIEVLELTSTRVRLRLEPTAAIKRIFAVVDEIPMPAESDPKKPDAAKEPEKAPAVATPPKVGK